MTIIAATEPNTSDDPAEDSTAISPKEALPVGALSSSPRFVRRFGLWAKDLLRRLGRDTLFLLTEMPLALISMASLVCAVAFSIGTLPLFLAGIPLGYLTMRLARIFAQVARARMRAWGREVEDPVYQEDKSSWFARLVAPFVQPQYWADVVFGIVYFPIAMLTWVLTILAWILPFGLYLGVPLTAIFQPKHNDPVVYQFVTLTSTNPLEVLPYSLSLGTVMLVALPWFVHRLAVMNIRFAAMMIGRPNHRELSERLKRVTASRAEVLEAEARSLRKLERDIHDGPQQQLVRLGMDMSIARLRLKDNPGQVDQLLEEAQGRVRETLAELRALTRGFAPPLLADRGLEAALRALCARATIPVDLGFTIDSPPGVAAETTAYFVVSESLTNIAKHAGAAQAQVLVETEAGHLVVTIGDDGEGGAVIESGGGIAGLRSRVEAHDGSLTLVSPMGGPTTVQVRIPDSR